VRRAPGVLLAAVLGTAVAAGQPATPKTMPPAPAERMRAEIVRAYPHDHIAFTQGLVFDGGRLYESTGLVGRSSLREVELESGRVIRKVDVPPPIFAEGLALVGERLIQLTWQNGRALVYDRKTFTKQSEIPYQGEGWGLCRDGERLIMSDGSANLTVRRANDFGVARTIAVTLDGQPLDHLNELECADGAVYANVWTTDLIVRIDLASGRVTHRIEAANLLSPLERQNPDQVLNGIAYDPADGTFLVTGKLWPKLFRVRFIRAR
jgi:glutaminyl-peptide cyclotransferase